MKAERVYIKDIPYELRRKIANELIDVWFYEGNDCYFLMSHPMAGEAIKIIESHMSPSEKALEALIKLVVELEDTVTSYHVTNETMRYAHEALKANGLEVYQDHLTRAHYRRVDYTTNLTGANGREAHLAAVKERYPERLEDKQ